MATIIAAFVVIIFIYVTAEGRPELSYLGGKIRDGLAPYVRGHHQSHRFFEH